MEKPHPQPPEVLPNPGFKEKYMLGEVRACQPIDPGELGIPRELTPGAIYSVDVSDPYLEGVDAEALDAVRIHESRVNDYAAKRRAKGMWERKVGTAYTDHNGDTQDKGYEWGDPVSHKEFFGEMDSPALDTWLKLVPSAKALAYLSDPASIETISDRDGLNEVPIDDMARLWLTGCTDAIAIRGRGTIMAELVKQYVEEAGLKRGEGGRDDALRWMSVACGTALPAMKAAIGAQLKPELILVDNDKNAMESTLRLGKEIGFQGDLSQHETNIFSRKDMGELSNYLGYNGGRPRIIDLMGIFEYTGDMLGINSAKFLKSNYDMLHPGGRMIFGQMRSDRPNADFTMGVVSWPWIMMRTPKEVMEIVQESGIPTETASLYLAEDGVYTVAVVDKPE